MITSMLAAPRVDVKNPKIFVEISFVSAEFQRQKNLSICYCTESSLGSGSGLGGQNRQRHRVTTLVMDHPRSEYD